MNATASLDIADWRKLSCTYRESNNNSSERLTYHKTTTPNKTVLSLIPCSTACSTVEEYLLSHTHFKIFNRMKIKSLRSTEQFSSTPFPSA
jgi:hypothetical protein